MTDPILQRLETSAIESLTGLVMDHLLSQPIADLIDPPTMAQQAVLTLRQALQSEQTEARNSGTRKHFAK